MHVMCFDQIRPHSPSSLTPPLVLEHHFSLPALCALFKKNPRSPPNTAVRYMALEPSAGAWVDYLGLHPWGKLILTPAKAISCQQHLS